MQNGRTHWLLRPGKAFHNMFRGTHAVHSRAHNPARIPRAFARSALEEGSVFQIRLTEIVPEREICVISRTDTPLSLAGNAFLRLFSDFAEPSCIKKDCR